MWIFQGADNFRARSLRGGGADFLSVSPRSWAWVVEDLAAGFEPAEGEDLLSGRDSAAGDQLINSH
jgi:hypothetical protein